MSLTSTSVALFPLIIENNNRIGNCPCYLLRTMCDRGGRPCGSVQYNLEARTSIFKRWKV